MNSVLFKSTQGENFRLSSKFIFVGILNTIVGYGLFALLIDLNIFYLLSLTISHIAGTIHSYLWNRLFTFKSKSSIVKEITKFVTVYTFIYLTNFVLLYVAVDLLQLNTLIAQLFILGVVTVISFLSQRYWTFRRYY
ncbi:hypothetical protein A3D81_01240 [Candidatus Curtissbacteria bacterium RIFCSPHIGHO2_02_FULL_40_17]|uniref:GtrA/DPMS transmembrane domain-containing protein n=4 Tax=Candidatus Curtissiibacteriota TaxID=1752717 RepID=A0A1F5GHR7_9BACT|nr:MAG: hypothetical protein A2693_02800 [Candidatus Curtissbacteria bacterium RIFCSPHIGHO2_01_FULL_40_12]OGD91406.1 MAG: hypothetical protein A3D81_01240 [Candidatus Curtissbacteria bacterium RIFCSPHIGHO2_02_FULL_40_17]OGE04062.1 MAG: hypothetical protein A3F45_02925 [Candidatus Curtissbacteria bacterium RIFCSPHIGHO2_12_FULL_41_17]OGE08615.1 MAG: hypothetical protein A3I53_02495 [Candidatus Curtissbacteria bacterium RIFCSPLOWO2_02_FULL_40_13b]